MTPEERRISAIQRLVLRYACDGRNDSRIKVGVDGADDCAVLKLDAEHDLVVGSDFVRGEGFALFKAGLLTRADIGYYLVGANISDIAAMGALPLGVLTAVRYSSQQTDAEFEEIMTGVCMACAEMGAPLLGGDTGSYVAPVLSAAALGIVDKDRALLRRNAQPGDLVVLSGSVGTAGAAFELCQKGWGENHSLSPGILAQLLEPWQRVRPALQHGKLLSRHGLSTCGLDTSDGLKTSCRILANASNLSIVLDPRSIPIGPGVREVAQALGLDALSLACSDSVDFRLLFTVNPKQHEEMCRVFNGEGLDHFVIGRAERGDPDTSDHVLLETPDERTPLGGVEKVQ